MKRSEINANIKWAEDFLAANNIRLPDMAYWSLDDWKANRVSRPMIDCHFLKTESRLKCQG